MSKTTNCVTKGVRMQRVPHHDLARGVHVTVGIAMAALFCRLRPDFTGKSTIIWQQLHFDLAAIMLGEAAPAADRGLGRLEPKNFE
jgi:hypothetical protein